MVETNDITELLTRLNEQAELIADVLDEIRTELQWGVRNDRIRIVSMAADPCADDMRINEASGTTMCVHCDTEVDSLAEAMRLGWTQLQRAEPPSFLGVCTGCAQPSTDLDEGNSRDAAISDLTKCESCEAEAASPQEALRQAWDSFRKEEHHHVGRCPGCAGNNVDPDVENATGAETAETVSELTKCDTCDAEVSSPPEALRQGWDSFRKGEHHHHGRCPDCAKNAESDAQREPGRLF